MHEFLCNLWAYLAGGLIGWLLCGWLARRLKYGEPPVEKTIEKKVEVEKVVDNPDHLALINTLKEENSQISGFKARITSLENAEPDVVEKIVEVEKQVDNPQHLERIGQLEEETRQIAGLHARIKELEDAEPEVTEKVVEVEKIVEKLVDNPEHLRKIGELEGDVEAWKRGPVIDLQAARAAGIRVKSEDDFTAIEGIGPKINDLIHAAGIHTFSELARTEAAEIQKILDDAGPGFALAKPDTWPAQSDLAAANRWEALKAWQDILDGGKE